MSHRLAPYIPAPMNDALLALLPSIAQLSGKGYQINLPWRGRYPRHSSPLIDALAQFVLCLAHPCQQYYLRGGVRISGIVSGDFAGS